MSPYILKNHNHSKRTVIYLVSDISKQIFKIWFPGNAFHDIQ